VARVTTELSKTLDLEVAQTRYSAHAEQIAADAAADGFDLVLPFGGDGTLNEVVNGLMRAKPSDGATLPAIAPIPAGGANVFAQSFGYPPDQAEAARRIAQASPASFRTIGVGLAGDRYFTFSAGLGLDAEVVHDVNLLRGNGRHATPGLYMRTALRRYYMATDRREPALTLYSEAGTPVSGLFMGVVTNSSPWTYVGRRPVSPVPRPDFSSGLDVFALRRLRTLTTLRALRQMLHTRDLAPQGTDVVTLDGLCVLTFRSRRPIAFQVDGEYLGEVTELAFRYVPNALRVLALRPPA
jgi:diacylglycerol kinase family enzyme